MQRMSAHGRADLIDDEGLVTKAYKCPAGVWTIGVGHTSAAGSPKVRPGMEITRGQAEDILKMDLATTFEPRVRRVFPQKIDQPAFDGFTSFDFNTGAIDRASFVPFYKRGEHKEARRRFMLWVKGGGRTIPGLVRRRHREADKIWSGRYGSLGPQTIDTKTYPRDVRNQVLMEYQKKLIALGYNLGPTGADGKNGTFTRNAVIKFQKKHPDLVVDGILGRATKAQIDRSLKLIAKGAGGGIGGIGAGGSSFALDGMTTIALVVVAVVVIGFAIYLIREHKNEIKAFLRKV